MKFRLFGDLETIGTIGKGIMNVSPCSALRAKGLDALKLYVVAENVPLFHSEKVYKGRFFAFRQRSENEQIYRRDKQSVNSV